jgi:hypothetical protein
MSTIANLKRTASRVPAMTMLWSKASSFAIRASKQSIHHTFAFPLLSFDSGALALYPGWSWK